MKQLDQQDAGSLVEHFFRHEYAKRVSVLTRIFGLRQLDLVEDMVSAAMVQAMHTWKQKGVPANPAAWIHRVAHNGIVDTLRREKTHLRALAFSGLLSSSSSQEDAELPADSIASQWLDESSLNDSLLRMMFVCCHPILDRKSQLALTLKLLCGFSIQEIARGLLLKADAVKKRIQRAKRVLREANLSLELPRQEELEKRLAVVHEVLYLMFNEGYWATQGGDAIRDDVCEEAARLCHLLCQNGQLSSASTRALLSLMLLHASRMPGRTDSQGQPVLLADQDRSCWDHKLMAVADYWLMQSGTEVPTRYHLEAAIAKLHCVATNLEETDWRAIIRLYDRLLQISDSPVYRLNRAIALGQSGEHELALEGLNALRESRQLDDYFLLDCAVGHVCELGGDYAAAMDAYLSALSSGIAEHQKSVIERKLVMLSQHAGGK